MAERTVSRKVDWPVVITSALGLLLVLDGFLWWFSRAVPGFDTHTNHLELKNHRDKYEAIVAAVMKYPLPKEGNVLFLLSPPGAATVVTPCSAASVSAARPGDLVSVEIKPGGRILIWITTFPGNHFGQYYLVYCSTKLVVNEDFNMYHQAVQLDEHWWAVEDHSG
jgi:hypothetical protein